jgi:sulfur relay (sulfurtransferase) complex TusBCD TusD component (DsrE family)
MRLAEAALEKGHQVGIFASGDGVYGFVKDQRAKGVPNAQEGFEKLIRRGLTVEL